MRVARAHAAHALIEVLFVWTRLQKCPILPQTLLSFLARYKDRAWTCAKQFLHASVIYVVLIA